MLCLAPLSSTVGVRLIVGGRGLGPVVTGLLWLGSSWFGVTTCLLGVVLVVLSVVGGFLLFRSECFRCSSPSRLLRVRWGFGLWARAWGPVGWALQHPGASGSCRVATRLHLSCSSCGWRVCSDGVVCFVSFMEFWCLSWAAFLCLRCYAGEVVSVVAFWCLLVLLFISAWWWWSLLLLPGSECTPLDFGLNSCVFPVPGRGVVSGAVFPCEQWHLKVEGCVRARGAQLT